MSDDEHRNTTEYYKRMIRKKQEFERLLKDIVMKIIFNGSPGDLVENKNETGYRAQVCHVRL